MVAARGQTHGGARRNGHGLDLLHPHRPVVIHRAVDLGDPRDRRRHGEQLVLGVTAVGDRQVHRRTLTGRRLGDVDARDLQTHGFGMLAFAGATPQRRDERQSREVHQA